MGQSVGDLRSAVERMMKRLRHRGPDGSGTWTSPSNRAMFAHTRLTVFDPSPSASQPMSVEHGRLTITYNGALYNSVELRDQLRRRGQTFCTTSDTEVIIRAYQCYGAACVDLFRGMFAMAVWDEQQQSGFLARDPFGMKPLYYSEHDGRIVFASELRALAASGMIRGELDATAVRGYFQQGSVPEPLTLLEDAKVLPAGATACWKDGILTLAERQQPPWFDATIPASVDPVTATRSALVDSVGRHFAGDTTVGILLSGGADSTAILALAPHHERDRIPTFSLAMPGSAADEGADAARNAAAFGSLHHTLDVDATTARRAFADYSLAIDQPTIDGLNTFVAARLARSHGVKVVLSGIGADELFGGYATFAGVPRLAAWHRRAASAGPVANWAGRAIERVAPGPRVRRLGDLLSQPPSIVRTHATFRGIFTRRESAMLTRHYTSAVGPVADTKPDDDLAHSPETVSALEMTRYVRNQLVRDADVMAMAAGVEVRAPFLDRVVASTLWTIPQQIRFRAGKRLLADAVPEVPSRAFVVPKRCFQFPFDQWLDGEWRDVFAGIEESAPVPTETWYRKWCVFSMEQAIRNLSEARHG